MKLPTTRLLKDVRSLIESARAHVAKSVNTGLVFLYWQIGQRIRRDILQCNRAEYGERIVVTVSRQLSKEYGRGFARDDLFRMIQFAERFPDSKIVGTLSPQLSWSHFLKLIPIKDSLKRDFYAEMCRVERWDVRTLRAKISGMLFERTALSKKPVLLVKKELTALRKKDKMSPDLVFRDPYFLDFLGLKRAYSEKDLESSILRELENFLLEFGTHFSFVARQKRITIDDEDYHLDLLFFHRRLRRLVAIDLKLGPFQAQDKGQIELYLRWLEKYERLPGEGSPIGLILCAGKSKEHVELLRLEKSAIRVAEYLTELPPRKVFEKKLREVIRLARHSLALKSKRLPSRAVF